MLVVPVVNPGGISEPAVSISRTASSSIFNDGDQLRGDVTVKRVLYVFIIVLEKHLSRDEALLLGSI
jgi:hypothetical protein